MIKLKDTHKSLLVLLVVVFSFAFITKVIAVMNPYDPGATKDPECRPTDLNCTVNIKSNLYKENAQSRATNVTSGEDAVAIGSNNIASGRSAIALGQGDGIESDGASASGDYSLALGSNSHASALGASALGYGSTAQGIYSAAVGFGAKAYSYKEVAFGAIPTYYTPGSTSSWVSTDRLFNVGNGNGSGSDALTILKNGNIGIGTSSPEYILDINSNGAMHVPVGDKSNQPIATVPGLLRYNTDQDNLEYSDKNGGWVDLGGSNSGGAHKFYAESTDTDGKEVGVSTPGLNSIGIGNGVVAGAFGQITLGMFNAGVAIVSNTEYDPRDALLVVGNGKAAGNRSNALVILKSGQVGLGVNPTESSGNALEFVSGAHVTTAGSFVDASDQALKENVEDLPYGLREVNEMQPRSFDYKIDGSHSIGFVAQEMESVIPEVVSGKDGHKGISYGQLTAVLVNAVQELSDRVDQLEAQQGISRTVVVSNNNQPSSSNSSENNSSSSSSSSTCTGTNLLLLIASSPLLSSAPESAT